MRRIGIIGGGASGVLAAIHCWQKVGKEVEITIIDPSIELGRGRAFQSKELDDLLNVSIDRMSAFPDRPNDFLEWVEARDSKIRQFRHWPFVPRAYFAQYLQELLKKIPISHFHHVRARVTGISIHGSSYRLLLKDDQSCDFDYLVFATGYREDSFTEKLNLSALSVPFRNRILPAAKIQEVDFEEFSGSILILGSGLTAIDVWRRLRRKVNVTFKFLSLHGLLPLPHEPKIELFRLPNLVGMSPLQILQVLRAIHHTSSISWPSIADQIRPQVQKIWSCWTEKEKNRFLRNIKSYWEIIRHRVPSSVFEELKIELTSGRCQIQAGRVQSIQQENGQLKILYRKRRADRETLFEIKADWIILATGTEINQDLHSHGSIPGINICPHGLGYSNNSASRVWILGPASKSTFWEITSVPDIRLQAETIAKAISDNHNEHHSLAFERISAHPYAAGESYFLHFKQAMKFGLELLRLGVISIIHAVFPVFYTDHISSRLRNLTPRVSRRRQRVSTDHEIEE